MEILTLLETNIFPLKARLKMSFLFPRYKYLSSLEGIQSSNHFQSIPVTSRSNIRKEKPPERRLDPAKDCIKIPGGFGRCMFHVYVEGVAFHMESISLFVDPILGFTFL